MADLFKKNAAPAPAEAPVAADANAPEAPAPKAKKEKKSKQQYLEQNKMNFKEQYEIVVEGKKKNLDLKKIMKPLILVGIVVLAVFVVLEVVLIGMKAKTKSLNNYINDEANIASYNQAIDTKTTIEAINAKIASTEDMIKAIDSYPNVGTEFYKTIVNTGTNNGVEVTDYAYTNTSGYLSITCVAKDVDNISKFVRGMEECGLFDDVTYTGFSGDTANGYSFQLTCICLGDQNVEAPAVVVETPAEEAPAEENVEG